MKAYELDKSGYYIGDIPFFNPASVPKYYTTVALTGTFFKPRFDGKVWVEGDTRENNIGTVVYSTTTKEQMVIQELGPIPEGYTTQVPREFDTWDGQLWITDAVLRNKVLKARKVQQVNAQFEALVTATTRATYPDSEVMSWAKQENEARNYAINNAYATPLLDLISQIRGMSKDELVTKVIQKSDQFAQQMGKTIGRRQYLEDQINAVEVGNESTLDQISF